MDQREDWHLTDTIEHEQGRGDPFAAAIRGTRMPMVITDPRQPDNPIIFANSAFQSLTGYDRSEIIGRNCRFLQGPDSDRDAVRALGEAIRAGEACEVELLNYRKDGSTFWNALFISPVRNEAGDIQFFFGSQLDVTERVKRHEAVLREKEHTEKLVRERTAELQAALAAKTTLLTELDHRVKNNLTMIGSLLRLQSRSMSGPELRAALEEMLVRVDALGVVHRHLFQEGDLTKFDLATFAKDLFGELPQQLALPGTFVFSVEPVEIDANIASAAGLLLNELVYQARLLAGPVKARLGVDGITAVFEVKAKSIEFQSVLRNKSAMASELIERLRGQTGATLSWIGDDTVRVILPRAADTQ